MKGFGVRQCSSSDYYTCFQDEPAKTFQCSFDISDLFTNVPLDKTVEICADALYRVHFDCLPFLEDTFRELMPIATRGVKFSFSKHMYK